MTKSSFRLLVVIAVALSDPLLANQIIEKILDNRPLKEISMTFSADELDKIDDSGNAPIHIAVCKNRTDVIVWLAQSGANLTALNDFGMSPLEIGIKFGCATGVLALVLFLPKPAHIISRIAKSIPKQVFEQMEGVIVKTLLERYAATFLMRNAAYESILVLENRGLPPHLCRRIAAELINPDNMMNYFQKPWAKSEKLSLIHRWLRVGYELDFDEKNRVKNRRFDELSDVIYCVFQQRIVNDLPRGDEPDQSDALAIWSFLEQQNDPVELKKSNQIPNRRAAQSKILYRRNSW